MKAFVQRVMNAKVTVNDEEISSIGRGLCVLIGICKDDTEKDAEYIARKLLTLRVFEDDSGKRWSKSVVDQGYEVLCVSQFTLYHTLKGNKPDFRNAMGTAESKALYEKLLNMIRKQYKDSLVKDGLFGAYMQVHIQNDGPVTVQIESPVETSNKSTES